MSDWSAREIERIATHSMCLVLLVAILIDAARSGLARIAVQWCVVPFIVGIGIVDLLEWFPNRDAILLWFCICSTYYMSLRLNHRTRIDSVSPQILTKSFLIMWFVYANSKILVFLCLFFVSQSNGRQFDSTSLAKFCVQRCVEWIVVLAAGYGIGKFFERSPRYGWFGAIWVFSISAALISFYNFEGSGMWRFYWKMIGMDD